MYTLDRPLTEIAREVGIASMNGRAKSIDLAQISNGPIVVGMLVATVAEGGAVTIDAVRIGHNPGVNVVAVADDRDREFATVYAIGFACACLLYNR